MPLDVCICTHQPREDILALVVAALARQDVESAAFRVLLVDNASAPPLDHSVLAPLEQRGVQVRVVREERLGLSHARMRAISETDGDWVLFVDDDNELQTDYLAVGLRFSRAHTEVGCFGGRLQLPTDLTPPPAAEPFLAYLGIKDAGDETLICASKRWGPWEPAGAGAWVHRRVLLQYAQHAKESSDVHRLGRKGTNIPASCDDSLMMRSAHRIGLANAYVPQLVLTHHLDRQRFRRDYLLRLMRAYGASHVLLEHLLAPDIPLSGPYTSVPRTVALALLDFIKGARHTLLFGIGRFSYHLGARDEYLRLSRQVVRCD